MNTQGIESSGVKINEYSHFEYKSTHVKYEKHEKVAKDDFEFNEDLNVGKYDSTGKVAPQTTSKFHLILAIQKQIDEQVQELTKYYSAIFEKSDEGQKAKKSLKNYFDENPEALKEIEKGEIPDYWNKENTAKRIFDIALHGYNEDVNMDEFYKKTKNMIEQAYSEVEEMMGELPTLVTDTKDVVLKGLSDFNDGKDVSEITFS